MATEHNVITDPNIHEPKGASTATVGEVYVSDGAGSGTWRKVSPEDVDSLGETYGQLITADGVGGSSWGQLVWKDLPGTYVEDVAGPTRPIKATLIGSIDAWAYSVNDAVDYQFHLPHDYALGTDIYLHTHWGHNGTNISGNLIWACSATLGARNAAVPYAPFAAPISLTINSNTISGTMNITNYPRYCHVVEEIQLSSNTPTAEQFNTSLLRPDSLILLHMSPSTIPTITGGSPNEPFLFFVDIHYQADIYGTKNKDPDFYA